MVTQVIGLGAGGHAKVVVEALRAQGGIEIVALVDARAEYQGQLVLGVPVVGDDGVLPDLAARGLTHFFVGVGSVGNSAIRRRLYELALRHGFEPVRVIHPASTISPSATLARGVTILAGAIVNASAQIGENVVVNTGAIVEHDCILGAHCHVATGARLAGAVQVGCGAHVGAGATIRQGISIGEGAIIGIGAAVVRNVPPAAVHVGVPARELKAKEALGHE